MKRLLVAAIAASVLLPSDGEAQLAPVPNAQEYLNYLNASSAVASTGLSSNVMVGPYQGQFENSAGQAISSSFAVYCVDYFHYAGNVDNLVNAYGVDGSLGGLGTTRLGAGGGGAYLKAAYLASLFETAAPTERPEVWSALHAAIWQTTSGTNRVSDAASPVGQLAQTFFNMAVPDDFDGSGWYVLTNATVASAAGSNYDGTGQEFLIQARVERSVPEPGTMLLMITGLLLMVGANRRRLVETR